MFDIKFIRDNPNAFDAGLARRGLNPRAGEILALDEEARKYTHVLNELQERRNAASKQIGAAKAKGDEDEFNRLRAEVDTVKKQMPVAEAEQKKKQDAIREILSGIPNIPADDVPEGENEGANVELRTWGEPKSPDNAKEHFDIGEALGQMDFETAANMSGARFVLLKGQLARFERAIANFMLDLHTGEFDYTEVAPPLLVKDDALYGTGQLPKFAEDLFKTTGDHWLIPTAEVSLTNMVRDQIVAEEELPMRLTAWTPCFRSEAGSAGRDTRGMIRLHQFAKVELVSVTAPDQSKDEHERMIGCAEEVLKRLDLPFRTMVLSTGDMGFGARKTYDIEVWLPGQKAYREISSVSNCGDFQALRMNARCRPKGEKQTKFVHTLNGSGLAVGRTMVAILENYQEADGSVTIPEALRPYMNGLTKIEAK
ncbi:serine--tRNA ligase [Hyphococcus sp. DH-69]|uniref:serine--tRNA ligase n=1 Tax=Hyphococcus formosus TaxID=3143534 RepID=UPI00398A62C6